MSTNLRKLSIFYARHSIHHKPYTIFDIQFSLKIKNLSIKSCIELKKFWNNFYHENQITKPLWGNLNWKLFLFFLKKGFNRKKFLNFSIFSLITKRIKLLKRKNHQICLGFIKFFCGELRHLEYFKGLNNSFRSYWILKGFEDCWKSFWLFQFFQ